jgi:hypothetical protein
MLLPEPFTPTPRDQASKRASSRRRSEMMEVVQSRDVKKSAQTNPAPEK